MTTRGYNDKLESSFNKTQEIHPMRIILKTLEIT